MWNIWLHSLNLDSFQLLAFEVCRVSGNTCLSKTSATHFRVHQAIIVKKEGSPSERGSEWRNAGTVGDLALSPGGSARGQPCRGEESSNWRCLPDLRTSGWIKVQTDSSEPTRSPCTICGWLKNIHHYPIGHVQKVLVEQNYCFAYTSCITWCMLPSCGTLVLLLNKGLPLREVCAANLDAHLNLVCFISLSQFLDEALE